MGLDDLIQCTCEHARHSHFNKSGSCLRQGCDCVYFRDASLIANGGYREPGGQFDAQKAKD